MIRKRLTKRVHEQQGYQPRLVITVEGVGDVYRIARALEQDTHPLISPIGQRILRSMDEQEPGVVRDMVALLGPAALGRRVAGRRRRARQLKLELGMPPEAVAAIAEVIR